MPRLRHVSRGDLTIERRRQGRGHAFVDPDGRPFGDAAFRSRVKHLGIPPAWREVRVAADPLAHIQAHGLDDAGRVRYIYRPDWEARRRKQLATLWATADSRNGMRQRDAGLEAILSAVG